MGKLRSIFAAWVLVFVAGCASGGSGVTVSAYDGDYITSNQTTIATQSVSGVLIDCTPMTESLFIRIRKGIASGYLHRDENYSFRTVVKANGRLTAIIPIDSYYQYLATSPVSYTHLTLPTIYSV